MEGQAVVDAPDVTVRVQQAMPALAVGVVNDPIEGRYDPKVRLVGGHHGEVVLLEVGVDEELEGPRAQLATGAIDGRWDNAPPEGLADQVGGHLPLAQRPLWEIIERSLPLGRLVNRQRLLAFGADLGQVRVVRAVGHQAPDPNRPRF